MRTPKTDGYLYKHRKADRSNPSALWKEDLKHHSIGLKLDSLQKQWSDVE
jgi:hypothetical protein